MSLKINEDIILKPSPESIMSEIIINGKLVPGLMSVELKMGANMDTGMTELILKIGCFEIENEEEEKK